VIGWLLRREHAVAVGLTLAGMATAAWLLVLAVRERDWHGVALWVLILVYPLLLVLVGRSYYHMGWWQGRTAMVDSLGEARRLRMSVPDWTLAEVRRPPTWPSRKSKGEGIWNHG
jgi:hypothetical protein